MLRALNDGAAGIRSEAFKAAMNLPARSAAGPTCCGSPVGASTPTSAARC